MSHQQQTIRFRCRSQPRSGSRNY